MPKELQCIQKRRHGSQRQDIKRLIITETLVEQIRLKNGDTHLVGFALVAIMT